MPNETNSTLAFSTVTTNQAGPYSVRVSNERGSITSTTAIVGVLTLGQSLNATQLVWTTGGSRPWIGLTNASHDGVSAAQSGTVSLNGSQSWLETTVTGPGLVTFWRGISTRTFCNQWGPLPFQVTCASESVEFSIGGSTMFRDSGTDSDWTLRAYRVPTGSQVLRWTYQPAPFFGFPTFTVKR